MRTATAPRRPGRARESPTPLKITMRLRPELWEGLDKLLACEPAGTTMRSIIERAVERELRLTTNRRSRNGAGNSGGARGR